MEANKQPSMFDRLRKMLEEAEQANKVVPSLTFIPPQPCPNCNPQYCPCCGRRLGGWQALPRPSYEVWC